MYSDVFGMLTCHRYMLLWVQVALGVDCLEFFGGFHIAFALNTSCYGYKMSLIFYLCASCLGC